MTSLKKILLFVVLLCVAAACNKADFVKPQGAGALSGAISNVTVENLPGSAKITYSLPDSEDILYVKAVYSTKPGIFREVKASYFKNYVVLDGFADENEYEVKLYAVNRAEAASEPVIAKVKPLTPPVIAAFQDVQLNATFGGAVVTFTNSSEAELTVFLMVEDETGKLVPVQTFYTAEQQVKYSVRGFDNKTRKFATYIKDRWDNYSETVYADLTPLLESELDKGKFSILRLAGDTWENNATGRTLEKIWDNKTTGAANSFNGKVGAGFPQHFTFDLGTTTTLSRMVYYPKAVNNDSYTTTARYWEIWGSNNPDPDGGWNNWVKLLDCELIKPSGLPGSEYTAEDLAYCLAGVNYDFPPGTPAVRYLRHKTLSLWSGSNLNIYEITLFGAN
jgi:hypothetical protein